MLKVFLSSTFQDLVEYRDKVYDVLDGFELVGTGMENFGASGKTPLATCLERLEGADRVVVLVGTRYGTCIPESKISYTETEVRRAIELDKPIMVYALNVEIQRVLQANIDTGEAAERLRQFKEFLWGKYAVQPFTTPEDLAMKLARDLSRYAGMPNKVPSAASQRYRETAYDSIAQWYDMWYQGHWSRNQPYDTITGIVGDYEEGRRGVFSSYKILDCATGTGNTFSAFTKAGLEIYGTDGSQEMLLRAKENCQGGNIPTDRLIMDPILWNDLGGYKRHFAEKYFDLIINTGNSFCHIPAVPDFMGKALSVYRSLLKPGGLLLIDTKRFIQADQIDGVQRLYELRYDVESRAWHQREERHEICKVDGLGDVHFHTRLMYDLDLSFGMKVWRALIVLTVYGKAVTPRVLVIPYYPLTSEMLRLEMEKAGFKATIFPALEGQSSHWKYDIVVGRLAS